MIIDSSESKKCAYWLAAIGYELILLIWGRKATSNDIIYRTCLRKCSCMLSSTTSQIDCSSWRATLAKCLVMLQEAMRCNRCGSEITIFNCVCQTSPKDWYKVVHNSRYVPHQKIWTFDFGLVDGRCGICTSITNILDCGKVISSQTCETQHERDGCGPTIIATVCHMTPKLTTVTLAGSKL